MQCRARRSSGVSRTHFFDRSLKDLRVGRFPVSEKDAGHQEKERKPEKVIPGLVIAETFFGLSAAGAATMNVASLAVTSAAAPTVNQGITVATATQAVLVACDLSAECGCGFDALKFD